MTDKPTDTYLAFGSNLGNREANIRMAIGRLTPLVRVDAVSSLYETPPMGVEDQPAFLNAVACVTTGLTPPALLRYVKTLEEEIGRRPGPRWGPRPIDIDILLMGDQVVDTDALTLPHPRLAERAFVLVPLAELAPDLVPPGQSDTIAKLAGRIDTAGITKVTDQGWERRGRGSWLALDS
jgi:2-amino-4-hydroxy-6-hydroxymethyldihydropteridine diphosphokinase